MIGNHVSSLGADLIGKITLVAIYIFGLPASPPEYNGKQTTATNRISRELVATHAEVMVGT